MQDSGPRGPEFDTPVLQGFEMKTVSVPLHWVHLASDTVSGRFRVGVVPRLPVEGVTLLLGNDIAGGNVSPVLEVVDSTKPETANDKMIQAFPHVFPACVLTRAQSRKLGDVVDLSDSFFVEPALKAPSSVAGTVFSSATNGCGMRSRTPVARHPVVDHPRQAD